MKQKSSLHSAESLSAAQITLRKHDSDVGSPQAQIARLTARIVQITEHLTTNRNDKHSRRGLIGLVNMRRKLLKYLKRTDNDAHAKTLSTLGLRK